MTNPNTLTAEKIAELRELELIVSRGGSLKNFKAALLQNSPALLSSAEQVSALQQRVGELEAEVHRQNCLMADRGHDNERLRLKNSTLEAALAEARKMPVEIAIYRLNEMLAADREAIASLFGFRVSCNETLANHPTCQVGKCGRGFKVGFIGIINGIFGTDSNANGFIAAQYEDDGALIKFCHYATPAKESK